MIDANNIDHSKPNVATDSEVFKEGEVLKVRIVKWACAYVDYSNDRNLLQLGEAVRRYQEWQETKTK